MIAVWKDLEGRTIKEEGVVATFDGYVLFFEDGERAHIVAQGEEMHGAHWPDLSDDEDIMWLGKEPHV